MSFDEERELFAKVRALPQPERKAFLEAQVTVTEIRQRILDMLAASEEEDNPLDSPPLPLIGPDVAEQPTLLARGTCLEDRYQISRYIASGSFGDVYEAVDLRLEKRVVVKVLQADGTWIREHFALEQKSLARLDHPGIVAATDCGVTAKVKPYLVLAFIEGHTLETELRVMRRFESSRAARLIAALGDALQHAHDRAVIHRDLKPGNIMLASPGGPDERPVIIDFGIAKMKHPGEDAATTTAISGTQHYWAPEQALGGRLTDRVDTFAFGLIAFEILTGQRFRRLEPGIALDGAMERRMLEFAPALPPEIGKLLANCIHVDPDARPAGVRDLAQQIRQLLSPETAPPPPDAPSPQRSRRSTVTMLAAGTALAATGAVGWYWTAAARSSDAVECGLQRKTAKGWMAVENFGITASDQIRLIIRPLTPVHLYLLSPFKGGHSVLFPSAANLDSRVRDVVVLPEEGGFLVDPSDGIIEIWAAISPEPISGLDLPLRRSLKNSDRVEDPSVPALWNGAPASSLPAKLRFTKGAAYSRLLAPIKSP